MKLPVRIMLAAWLSAAVGPAASAQPGASDPLPPPEARVKAAEALQKLRGAQEKLETRKGQDLRGQKQAQEQKARDAQKQEQAAEQQLRMAQERLERLTRELKAKEAQAEKEAADKMKEALERLRRELQAQEAQKPLRPVDPPKPATPAVKPLNEPLGGVRLAPGWSMHPPQPAAPSLRELQKSSDPKIAALAAELIERLAQHGPQKVQGSGQLFLLEVQGKPQPLPGLHPGAPVEKPGKPGENTFQFKVVPAPIEQPRPGARAGAADNPAPKPGAPSPEGVRARVVVIAEKDHHAAPAGSSLRLSADGKSAVVVGADGSITLFDVASGKEVMRFPGKK